jgi:hypothetical protein
VSGLPPADVLGRAVCLELHIDPATVVAGTLSVVKRPGMPATVRYAVERELSRGEQLRVDAAIRATRAGAR